MAPRKPPKQDQADAEEIYIRWAKCYTICGDEIKAARAINIDESAIEGFLAMARFSVAAQRIIAEDAASVPDFNKPESLREAVLTQLWKEAKAPATATGASARVSALKAISDIAGITNPEEATKGTVHGGLLMVPVMKMDAWEKQCEKAQAALRSQVHD